MQGYATIPPRGGIKKAKPIKVKPKPMGMMNRAR